jgi:hypothetical protein
VLRRVPRITLGATQLPRQDSNLVPPDQQSGAQPVAPRGNERGGAPSRSRTCVPGFGRRSRIHWTTGAWGRQGFRTCRVRVGGSDQSSQRPGTRRAAARVRRRMQELNLRERSSRPTTVFGTVALPDSANPPCTTTDPVSCSSRCQESNLVLRVISALHRPPCSTSFSCAEGARFEPAPNLDPRLAWLGQPSKCAPGRSRTSLSSIRTRCRAG